LTLNPSEEEAKALPKMKKARQPREMRRRSDRGRRKRSR
jgi:hypothetical protein